jgi:hypothetical protein
VNKTGFLRPFLSGLALLLATFLSAVPAEALRIIPGSFRVDPPDRVYFSRTITVTCEVEDDLGVGASGFDYEVSVEPGNAANMLSKSMPALSCTGSGRTRGVWVYQAVTPGPFRFVFNAGILGCRKALSYNVSQTSSPIEIIPVPVWSGQVLSPQVVAPGQEYTLKLDFRNDAPFEVVYAAPVVSPEVFGDFTEIADQPGNPRVVPASALDSKNRLLILPPGKPVSFTWRFKALRPGRTRYLITGGGMVVNSPVVNCRVKGNLMLAVPEQGIPVAVGREFSLRGRLHNTGEAILKGASVALTWSPQGSARLVRSSFTGPDSLVIDESPLDCFWRLEMLEPGPLSLSMNASATEADTGRLVTTSVSRVLRVLPPPELNLRVRMDGGTTLVAGSRAEFSVIVENRSRGAALNLVPILTLRQGSGRFTPLSPVFQGIAPGATAVFRGGFIPSEAGDLEIIAQASASGDRMGPRVTAVSDPVDLSVVPAPVVRVWTMNDRVFSGGESKARLWAENSRPYPLRIKSVQLSLSGAPADSEPLARVRFAPVTLAPHAGATIYAVFRLGVSTKTEEINAAMSFSGEILPYRLPFNISSQARLLALASPRVSRIAIAGPPNTFNPVRDFVFNAEAVIGKREEAGLVVMTPEGDVVRTLLRRAVREPGWYPAIWDGTDDSGKPVLAGKYVVRLAGPAPAGAAWPMGAKWKDDRQLQLERP